MAKKNFATWLQEETVPGVRHNYSNNAESRRTIFFSEFVDFPWIEGGKTAIDWVMICIHLFSVA
jgi:hypothetical protein